jgi:WD40 repeat protein
MRVGHTATLLLNGKVLVVGGTVFLDANPYWYGIGSAEIYDPVTAKWSATGTLNFARSSHMAVRLSNGKVLVLGGNNGYRLPITTAEIYDPETETWSVASQPRVVHANAAATLLADGRVLVTGGGDGGCCVSGIRDSAELYDPASDSWSQAGTMNFRRAYHTATLLPSGKVLVVGGFPGVGAELYDPTTDRWTVTGSLTAERLWDHETTLLPNGKVLVFGGGISGDDYCNGINSAELYDSETGQWSPTGSLIATRNDYYNYNNATVLPNGKVLVGGGASPGCNALNSSELYDPASESWGIGSSMTIARFGHTMTLLSDGRVLAVGGSGDRSAEIFDSGTLPVTNLPADGSLK